MKNQPNSSGNSLTLVDLQESQSWQIEKHQEALLSLIATCFSGIKAIDYFQQYFHSNDTFDRCLRLYFDGDKLVGYCLLTFRKLSLAEKKLYCLGASAAFYPEYRHANNTIGYSLHQAFKFCLKHPLAKIYYADTILSPAMYRAVAKQVSLIYPAANKTPPEEVEKLASYLKGKYLGDEIKLETSSIKVTAIEDDFCLAVGRHSNYSEQDLASFTASHKPEIVFYCQRNPDFCRGVALLTVIPISFRQFIMSSFKMLQGWLKIKA